MTNDEVFVEMQRLSKLINKLHKEKEWDKRNELVHIYRKLKQSYKFPFSVGDEVLLNNKLHTIKEHIEHGNRFVVANINRTPTVVCGTMLTKVEEVQEQLSIF